MKKILLSICFSVIGLSLHAQSDLEKILNQNDSKFAVAKTVNDYDKLFKENSQLIKGNDPARWKAYYYAGLSLFRKAELQIGAGKNVEGLETNALAFKYVSAIASPYADTEDVKMLLRLIGDQKLQIGSKQIILVKKNSKL